MKCVLSKRVLLKMLAAASVFFASCGYGNQSALNSTGVQSEQVRDLWWIWLAITATVYVIVMVVLIAAYFRVRRAGAEARPDTAPDARSERKASNIVKGCVALTALIVFTLMILSFRTGRAMATQPATSPDPIHIKVTGQQWWWQIEYVDDHRPINNVTTANEIHIPVGRPIRVDLESHDVIHSFWVPNLRGKQDLIPNYPTTIFFEADQPGIYWGQCAEFCGYEHAKMRLMVKAESQDDFNAWYAAAQQPSANPGNDSQARGRQIFLTSVCTQCHTISGTPASGRVGPNLTHVASKPYIASGSLVNNRENLMNWISDPQAIKPGIRMPMNTYSQEDLNALADYIQSLK